MHPAEFGNLADSTTLWNGNLPIPNDPAFDKANPDPATSWAPWRVFNIGNNQPATLMAYIEAIESAIGRTADKNFLPLQDGDVVATHADVSALQSAVGYSPKTQVVEGVRRFVDWYQAYLRENAKTAIT